MNEEYNFDKLSAAELQAVLFMRELKPWEKIEIKVIFKKEERRLLITKHNTTQEEFPYLVA